MRRQNQHFSHPPKHIICVFFLLTFHRHRPTVTRFAMHQPTALNFIIITRPSFLFSFVRSLSKWKWIKYDAKRQNEWIENVWEESSSLRCVWIVRKYVFISFKPFYIKISNEWADVVRGTYANESDPLMHFVKWTKNGKNAEQNFQFNFFSIAPTLRQINYWMRSLQCLQCIFHRTHVRTAFDGWRDFIWLREQVPDTYCKFETY